LVKNAHGITTLPQHPERDGVRLNRHRALGFCLSMIFSENRHTLFRIMLQGRSGGAAAARCDWRGLRPSS
jgi:hypothetical protein